MNIPRVARSVLCALLALCLFTPARAEWVKVSENPNSSSIFYFDPDSIRTNGGLRRVLELTDLTVRGSQGEFSRELMSEYDCRKGLWRVVARTLRLGRMATGEVLYAEPLPEEWRFITPGTASARILDFICSR
jgi:hypothetical protein